ncbi:hypothetical protein PF005_g19270 [Phytophthora fragariae]|uniref:RxLR effector protein n=1 Tax=Phytophthora fragariae TaxID=53985 RepID=A0A6A3R541_9STRA|nr:hypothetical protein PF003_g20377 [Phytophthora fragariae]KAE8929491.1 hypothetical protein PF009_g20391 [Phytophthora fragariae]KAE8990737.1 hypothetical protein PF011_g18229 [Phytophthora fragariae]KAE9089644.1 hypothetical protein PF010_g18908 [Phytophthora fragariae]KAE9090127.1 hypothetical protein PF007_g19354 [Phytophthora fragariae]
MTLVPAWILATLVDPLGAEFDTKAPASPTKHQHRGISGRSCRCTSIKAADGRITRTPRCSQLQ